VMLKGVSICVVDCEWRCGECVVSNGTVMAVLVTCAAKTGRCRHRILGSVNDKHWSFMGGHEPSSVKRKESVLYSAN
jgi:hypothetical protein